MGQSSSTCDLNAVLVATLSALAREIAKQVAAELRSSTAVNQAPPAPVGGCLGVADAAARLGIGQSTLRRIVARGLMPKVMIGSRMVFRTEDLDAYVAEHRQPGRVARPALRDRAAPASVANLPDPLAGYTPRRSSPRKASPEPPSSERHEEASHQE
jgi:excisionase family DNA binding protein